MAQKSEMKVGARIDGEDATRLDPAKMGLGLVGSRRPAEVDGEARSTTWILFPSCQSPPRCETFSRPDPWFRRGSCGGLLRVESQHAMLSSSTIARPVDRASTRRHATALPEHAA